MLASLLRYKHSKPLYFQCATSVSLSAVPLAGSEVRLIQNRTPYNMLHVRDIKEVAVTDVRQSVARQTAVTYLIIPWSQAFSLS